MLKLKLFISSMLLLGGAYAVSESQVQIGKSDIVTPIQSNLANIDTSTNNLIELKRKLEIEKTAAELKKIKSTDNQSNKTAINSENIQTTVTGVAINQDGRKIAWLQFSDGGSLTVNIGSKVGKYKVSDITMNGVQLSSSTKNVKHSQNTRSIFLKRVYYAPEKSRSTNITNNMINPLFAPSPIITNANSDDTVPPIVAIH